jgi:hypothetical protein
MRYFVLLLGFCFVLSCTKDSSIDLPPHEPKLVLHSYTAVGDTFKISLGKSLPQIAIVPGELTYVGNGWVVLYENDVFVDSLKYNAAEKKYVSSRGVASSGKVYRVRAGAPGFPGVEAFTTAPSAVNITSTAVSRNTRKTLSGRSLDDLKITFTDPPVTNFYLASIVVLGGSNCAFTYDPAVERFTSEIVPFETDNCINNDRLMYSDRSFNGMVKELTFSMYSGNLDSFVDQTGAVHRPQFKKYNITEDYYRYLKTSLYQDGFEETSLSNIPRNPKGNVKNGYGLFTVFAVVTDTIR